MNIAETYAIWLRDNAPQGWAFRIWCWSLWLAVCVVWGGLWGFVFADWNWIITSAWGRAWVVVLGLAILGAAVGVKK